MHEYLQKRMTSDGVSYWRCRQYFKNKCPSTLVTPYDDIIKGPGNHCHVGDCIQLSGIASKSTCQKGFNFHLRRKLQKTLTHTKKLIISQGSVSNLLKHGIQVFAVKYS
ncbi:unnamed protein product [Clavelina lepadiformis]|uniref:FLYWCH-type domain-containing protein n=1 Tax=Clavelina lepadiformis TaxID=159417 RepID=A0ABP0H189_CLALP